MSDDRTGLSAGPQTGATVERHFSGCPRLDTASPPRRPDLRPCTCDPGRLAAAIRPSHAGRSRGARPPV
ncbi:MAG TPA: hypothetical protein VMV02_06740 [Acidimicrobiales bacterium]|nr:hypothetical protein [Acidimicrobiales bacterium]